MLKKLLCQLNKEKAKMYIMFRRPSSLGPPTVSEVPWEEEFHWPCPDPDEHVPFAMRQFRACVPIPIQQLHKHQ